MPEYLTFALVAPIASFGDVAVGERRSGWDRPGRSAVLGVVGACLGVDRADTDAQAALTTDFGLALRCHAAGCLLADYHTAQVPSTRRGQRFSTRAAELAVPKHTLNTVLSRRDYRVGAWHLGALWTRGGAPRWSLTAIAAAMERPVYTPCLGRRACPLGLPLAPRVEDAADVAVALATRHADGAEAKWRRDQAAEPWQHDLLALDETDAGGLPEHRRTEFRRDQPLSRARWQFGLRAEAVHGTEPPA